jgi:2-polyprenyl-6-methoxyphenol hydroxylase-like FAD-dependent oxidoreductase
MSVAENIQTNNGVNNESNKESLNMVDVLIAGAGIGGLVTALCLHRAGYSVRIREQAQLLEPAGFGVNLQPYCVKLLHELGLEREMDEIGIRTRTVGFYSRNGQFIFQESRGLDAGYNWPMYSMHRGHFQELLLRHVRDEIGETSIQLSQKLVAFRSHSDHVEVDFLHPVTGHVTTELAKVLIGADGINSTIRKVLWPDEGPPLWEGLTMWRGVTPMDKIYLDGRTMICMGNPTDRYLITYPVNNSHVNWALVVRVEDSAARTSSVTPDWNHLGRVEDVLPFLSDMKLDFLDIHHLISSSIIVNQFPVSDRDSLPQWTHDRVTLLGDAAHPMYPNGGNGASQAILDARGLVLSFREHGVTPKGLQAYDDLRRSASHAVALSARQFGPDKILQIVDERSPSVFQNLSDVIAPSELEAVLSNYRQMAGWNAQQLNEETSLF